MRRLTLSVLGVVAVLVAWEIVARLRLVSPLVLPTFAAVCTAFIQMVRTGAVFRATGVTTALWVGGFGLGITAGATVGVVLALRPTINHAAAAPIAFVRALPPITIFPLALVVFGPTRTTILAVAVVGAAAYVLPGVSASYAAAQARFGDLATVLGATTGERIRLFLVPAAALHVLASARVAAAYSLAIVVAGEMLIGDFGGLGAAVLNASYMFRVEEVYALMIVTGCLGLGADAALRLAQELTTIGE